MRCDVIVNTKYPFYGISCISGEECYTDYDTPNMALSKPTYSSSVNNLLSHSNDGIQITEGRSHFCIQYTVASKVTDKSNDKL